MSNPPRSEIDPDACRALADSCDERLRDLEDRDPLDEYLSCCAEGCGAGSASSIAQSVWQGEFWDYPLTIMMPPRTPSLAYARAYLRAVRDAAKEAAGSGHQVLNGYLDLSTPLRHDQHLEEAVSAKEVSNAVLFLADWGRDTAHPLPLRLELSGKVEPVPGEEVDHSATCALAYEKVRYALSLDIPPPPPPVCWSRARQYLLGCVREIASKHGLAAAQYRALNERESTIIQALQEQGDFQKGADLWATAFGPEAGIDSNLLSAMVKRGLLILGPARRGYGLPEWTSRRDSLKGRS